MNRIMRLVPAAALSLGILCFTLPALLLAAEPEALARCQACHGRDGVASSPEQANLAGQHARYLVLQLRAFRSGERRHEIMTPMAEGLSDRDIDALSVWYSQQSGVSAADGDDSLLELGRQRAGYCHACHGMNGAPVADEWPVLAGQSAVYLAAQLRAFRGGERQHPLMQPVVRGLSDQAITELSAYYASIEHPFATPE